MPHPSWGQPVPRCGHNYPGASLPFGMLRLSPETASMLRGRKALNTSGYYYRDKSTHVGVYLLIPNTQPLIGSSGVENLLEVKGTPTANRKRIFAPGRQRSIHWVMGCCPQEKQRVLCTPFQLFHILLWSNKTAFTLTVRAENVYSFAGNTVLPQRRCLDPVWCLLTKLGHHYSNILILKGKKVNNNIAQL